jgi:hypothetical protein
MGKDDQPKHRQKERDLRRRAAIRQPYERLLIVCEGEKTEPQYLDEIRQERRLATAHVQVRPSAFGTEPLQVVEYAEHLFRHGDRAFTPAGHGPSSSSWGGKHGLRRARAVYRHAPAR